MKSNIKKQFVKKEILITLGPASIENPILQKICNDEKFIFRINTAHVDIETLDIMVQKIRNDFNKNICFLLDLSGSKIEQLMF